MKGAVDSDMSRDLGTALPPTMDGALIVGVTIRCFVWRAEAAHRAVPSRERFEQALEAFQGSVLTVVHDRHFVDKFATTIWHVQEGQLTEEIRQPMMV